MKKMRKGFTLVELLIVIAILGALSATMATSVSGSTAKAKAAAIVSNVETIKAAIASYLANNVGEDISSVTPDSILYDLVPSWKSFAKTGKITYTADGTAGTPSDWVVTVDFSQDADKVDIRSNLIVRPGYDKSYSSATDTTGSDVMPDNTYKFNVNLSSGLIYATPATNP